jgi:hypothetical protein
MLSCQQGLFGHRKVLGVDGCYINRINIGICKERIIVFMDTFNLVQGCKIIGLLEISAGNS